MRALVRFVVATLVACLYCSAQVAAGSPRAVQAGSVCAQFASPHGSDRSGTGTWRRPFRTLTRLDQALAPGQTGCLRRGVYGGLNTSHVLQTSGRPGQPVTLRSVPGQRATVRGWVDVEASYVTLEHLRIDGSNTLFREHAPGIRCYNHVSQPLVITGSYDTLQYVNYFQSHRKLRGVGIAIGFWGSSSYDTIRYSRIHDVGGCDFYDHIIYLAHGTGDQIYGNWMWNDPHGWGIKLDPGPENARIWGNVIDHAGSGFNFGNSSGAGATSGNEVFDNTVMNSVGISNPDIHWSHRGVLVTSPGLLPTSNGNAVFDNNSYRNSGGLLDVSASIARWQLRVQNNRSYVPHFADIAAHDYSLR